MILHYPLSIFIQALIVSLSGSFRASLKRHRFSRCHIKIMLQKLFWFESMVCLEFWFLEAIMTTASKVSEESFLTISLFFCVCLFVLYHSMDTETSIKLILLKVEIAFPISQLLPKVLYQLY